MSEYTWASMRGGKWHWVRWGREVVPYCRKRTTAWTIQADLIRWLGKSAPEKDERCAACNRGPATEVW